MDPCFQRVYNKELSEGRYNTHQTLFQGIDSYLPLIDPMVQFHLLPLENDLIYCFLHLPKLEKSTGAAWGHSAAATA
jgi:hypothetical protein